MRTFVAVFPPPGVQRTLIRAARDLDTDAFRLTAPERVHLTLRFLGEVPPGDIPRVSLALERIGQHADPFEASVSGFGVFPSARRARVLWAGIERGAEELRALARAADDLLEPEGFAREERPFVPHLTLGRARRPSPLDPSGAPAPEDRFTVREVDLVRSRQTGSGVEYEILAAYRL